MSTHKPPQLEPSRLAVLAVALLSQVVWFAAVLGAAHGHPYAGPISATLILPAGAILLRAPRRVFGLSVAALVIGLLIETTLAAADLVRYSEPGSLLPLPPLWLLSLWAVFALVIETALRAIDGKRILQMLIGGAGGPLAYLAGEKLGAMQFLEPRWLGLVVLSLLWACALPQLMNIRRALSPSSELPRGSPR